MRLFKSKRVYRFHGVESIIEKNQLPIWLILRRTPAPICQTGSKTPSFILDFRFHSVISIKLTMRKRSVKWLKGPFGTSLLIGGRFFNPWRARTKALDEKSL